MINRDIHLEIDILRKEYREFVKDIMERVNQIEKRLERFEMVEAKVNQLYGQSIHQTVN